METREAVKGKTSKCSKGYGEFTCDLGDKIRKLKREIKELKKCGSCGKPLSRDCPHCKKLWSS